MTSDPETDRLASLLAAQLAERAKKQFVFRLALKRTPLVPDLEDRRRLFFAARNLIEAEDLVVNP